MSRSKLGEHAVIRKFRITDADKYRVGGEKA